MIGTGARPAAEAGVLPFRPNAWTGAPHETPQSLLVLHGLNQLEQLLVVSDLDKRT
jgi:hypothetical protein